MKSIGAGDGMCHALQVLILRYSYCTKRCPILCKYLMVTSAIRVRKSVGQACLNTLHHRSLFKFHELPTPSDLATLANHLISTIEILNLSEVDDGRVSRRFKDAVTYIQARLLVFNKRRSGELEATRLVLLHACSYWEMD